MKIEVLRMRMPTVPRPVPRGFTVGQSIISLHTPLSGIQKYKRWVNYLQLLSSDTERNDKILSMMDAQASALR